MLCRIIQLLSKYARKKSGMTAQPNTPGCSIAVDIYIHLLDMKFLTTMPFDRKLKAWNKVCFVEGALSPGTLA